MNAYSTHRSAVRMSVAVLCLLTATAVFADGPEPKRPRDYPKDPVTRPTYTPTPTPTATPTPTPTVTPEQTYTPVIGRPDPTPPKTWLWWWISAGILLLLLLFFLFWILRRKKPTGYVTPPSKPTGPAYPPVDQSPQQTRPDRY